MAFSFFCEKVSDYLSKQMCQSFPSCLHRKLLDVRFTHKDCLEQVAKHLQKRNIDIVYGKEVLSQPRKSPWGNTQREQKYGLEFELHEYQEIDKYCKELNIDWFASAWDMDSLVFLKQFNLKFNKDKTNKNNLINKS